MEFSAFFCDCVIFDKFFDKFFNKKEFYGRKRMPAPQRATKLAIGKEFYPRKILKGIRKLIRELGNAGNLWYVYNIK
jgi:hypothetical protein